MAATIVQDFIVGERAWQTAVWLRVMEFHRNPAYILLACKLAAQCPIDSIRSGSLMQLIESTPTLTTVSTAIAGVELVVLGRQIPIWPLYQLIHCMNSSSGTPAQSTSACCIKILQVFFVPDRILSCSNCV